MLAGIARAIIRGEVDRYLVTGVRDKDRINQKLPFGGELSGKTVNDRSGKDMGKAEESLWISG